MTAVAPIPAWLDRQAYPFEHHWLRLASGARMHYVDEGSGPTVLFVHGTPTWSFEWRHAIRSLSPTFRCIAPDLAGMGLSDRPANLLYTPQAHAERLAEFVAALDLREVTLVVHDFGGPIGLPLAFAADERIARIVIMNTFGWSLADDPKVRRPARYLHGELGRILYAGGNLSLRVIMPAAFADRARLTPEIHRQYLEPFADKDARALVLHTFVRALLGSSAFYQRIAERLYMLRQLPALIIWGTKDPAFGESYLDRWRRELPDARVVALPVGHWPQEEAPQEVCDALHTFLTEDRLDRTRNTTHNARATSATRAEP